jgi:hypothetical protein
LKGEGQCLEVWRRKRRRNNRREWINYGMEKDEKDAWEWTKDSR